VRLLLNVFALLGLLHVSVAGSPGPPADDAVTRDRMEAMLEAGEEPMIIATFRRHPAKVLVFLDGYLEGGLNMIEQDERAPEARQSLRRGVAFAKLAQQAFNDDIFLRYAAAFASWSPTEQKRFREGQRLYREAREYENNGQYAQAMEAYRTSQHLAESLNDYWGMAMTLAGRTRAAKAIDQNDRAIEFGREALTLYRRLRLESSEIELLLLVGQLEVARNPRGSGLGNLRRAWDLVKARPVDDQTRIKVLDAYRSAVQQADVSHLLEQLDEELDEYGGSTKSNGANGDDNRN